MKDRVPQQAGVTVPVLQRSELVLLLVPTLVLLFFLVLFAAYEVDDAYILLRYGRNLAAGHGLAFNPGGPEVEGYSNLVYVLLAALLFSWGSEPMWLLKALGMAGALLCLPLTWWLMRKLGGSRSTAFLAALTLALSPGFAFWAVSGLETGFYALLICVATWLLMLEQPRSDLAAALLFVLAALTRPEAPLFFAAVACVRLLREHQRAASVKEQLRAAWPWLGTFAVLYSAYFAARWAYFGVLFPNPIYFKQSLATSSLLSSVSAQFCRGWWPFLLAAALLMLPFRRWQRPGKEAYVLVLILTALAAFARAQHFVAGGVGTMAFFDRYFMPVLPLLVVAAGLGIVRAATRRPAVQAAGWLVLIVWQLLNPAARVSEMQYLVRQQTAGIESRIKPLAAYVNQRYGDSARLAIGDAGLSGYLVKGSIYDLFGLTSYDFTQRDGRDLDRYLSRILDHEPDLFVLVGKVAEHGWKPGFYTDYALMANPDFHAAYVQTATFGRETSPSYYYLVFERRDR